jgi:Leucine-rich repeat (LRR) protein
LAPLPPTPRVFSGICWISILDALGRIPTLAEIRDVATLISLIRSSSRTISNFGPIGCHWSAGNKEALTALVVATVEAYREDQPGITLEEIDDGLADAKTHMAMDLAGFRFPANYRLAREAIKQRELDSQVRVEGLASDDGLSNHIGLEDVVHLGLMGKPITSKGLEHLRCMSKLKTLNLSGTKIDSLRPLEGLHNLERLSLNETPITDTALASLSKLEKLCRLELRNTSITDAGLDELARTNCTHVDLRGTNVTEMGAHQLWERCPTMTILD